MGVDVERKFVVGKKGRKNLCRRHICGREEGVKNDPKKQHLFCETWQQRRQTRVEDPFP